MKRLKKVLCVLLAIMIFAMACAGCGTKEANENEEISLLWYIPIDPQNDTTRIFTLANEYIKEKLGFVVDFVPVGLGDYESKIQIINAAKQPYDIVFTSNWLNNYEKAVHNGTLYDITELIKEYAPNTYNNIPEKFWDGTKVDGKIYGVINQQIMARGPAVMIPNKNLDMDVDFSAIKTWKDCEPFLKKYYEETGEYTVLNGLWQNLTLWHGMDEILGVDIVGAYRINDTAEDGKIEVFNQFESPEFLEYIKGRRQWFLNGWTEPTIGETFDYDAFVLEKGEDHLLPQLCVTATYKPGIEKETEATRHFPMTTVFKCDGFVSRNAITSTMTAVGAYSKHPEKALQLIELVNNDAYLMNLLSFGIEGHNYTLNEDGTIRKRLENGYNCNNWAIGNIFNCYVLEGADKDVWEQTAKLNNESTVSELVGFVPDISKITTEISNCTSASAEFIQALNTGVVDTDEYYNKFITKLKSGGCDTIVAELQRQVDEYLAKNK